MAKSAAALVCPRRQLIYMSIGVTLKTCFKDESTQLASPRSQSESRKQCTEPKTQVQVPHGIPMLFIDCLSMQICINLFLISQHFSVGLSASNLCAFETFFVCGYSTESTDSSAFLGLYFANYDFF